MGLDQYAVARQPDAPESKGMELACWRKHNRLQGWMEKLWMEKTGNTAEPFNCESVQLTPEDLDNLEKAINDMDLPETEGFFFGTDSYEDYEEYLRDDLAFIEKAREAINDGYEVSYSSWW